MYSRVHTSRINLGQEREKAVLAPPSLPSLFKKFTFTPLLSVVCVQVLWGVSAAMSSGDLTPLPSLSYAL